MNKVIKEVWNFFSWLLPRTHVFVCAKQAWFSSHIDDLNQEVHPWSPVGYTSPKLSWAKEKLDFIGYVHTVHLMEKNPKGEYVQFGG